MCFMQCEDKVFVYKINVDDAEMCYDTVPIYQFNYFEYLLYDKDKNLSINRTCRLNFRTLNYRRLK